MALPQKPSQRQGCASCDRDAERTPRPGCENENRDLSGEATHAAIALDKPVPGVGAALVCGLATPEPRDARDTGRERSRRARPPHSLRDDQEVDEAEQGGQHEREHHGAAEVLVLQLVVLRTRSRRQAGPRGARPPAPPRAGRPPCAPARPACTSA